MFPVKPSNKSTTTGKPVPGKPKEKTDSFGNPVKPSPSKQDSIFDHKNGTKLKDLSDKELDGVLKNIADYVDSDSFQVMIQLDPMIEVGIKVKTVQYRARVEKARRLGKKLYETFEAKFERFEILSLADEEIVLAYPELDKYLKTLMPPDMSTYKVSLDQAELKKTVIISDKNKNVEEKNDKSI